MLYNNNVKRLPVSYLVIIVLFLLSIILAPRIIHGVSDLTSANNLFAAGNYTAAASAYASAAARLPWDKSLSGLTGQAYWLSGEPEVAVTWFMQGDSRHALSQEDWLTYGDTLAALGDNTTAICAWKQSILLHGPSLEALSRLASTARQAGDYQAAIDYLEQASVLAPEDAGAHYTLGLLLAATAPEKALPELMQALDLQPDLEGTIQVLRTELNRAFLVEERAYQFTVSGRALASIGEWDLAVEAFRRAIEADENYAEAWAWLGEANQQVGMDGYTQLMKALALDPQSVSIRALIGLYWLRQGEPENALASYKRAEALEPENHIWLIALGDAASASGDLAAALEYYSNAIDLAPEDTAGWRALALFCLDQDFDVENTGLAAAQQLFHLAQEDWLTYQISGRVALRLDRRIEARSLLLKAIDLAPAEPSPHFYLALLYLESGLPALAYDKLVDTRVLDPEGAFGWQASRILEQYFP